MSTPAHIAIDLGAESGRAIVGSLDAGRLSIEEVHRFPHQPRRLPSGLHWDLTGLWGAVLEGVRRAALHARQRDLTLMSIGVDAWGVDYGLVGRSGETLGIPHCYRDQRNGPVFQRVMAAAGQEALYAATGIQPMAINTLVQLVAQREAEPAMLEQADALLFIPDLMHYFLTGRAVNEASIASTSQMVDPRTGSWAVTLLEHLGLPTHMLRPPVPAGAELGSIRTEVAEATGAAADLSVVTPAAHDTASAVAAVPAMPGTSWCYLSSGTWSLLGAELDAPCLSDSARRVPFTNEGGVAGSIRFLKNITGLWIVQECRRQLADAGHRYSYGQLTELAADSPGHVTFIDPEHPLFAIPGRMVDKVAHFARETGQPTPDDVGPLVRCCLESLALAYRHTLQQLEEVLDRRLEVIHIVGGGSRNTLLNQMTADATGRRVLAGPAEATAIGNVLVQAMGVGAIADLNQMRAVVAEAIPVDPFQPGAAGAWTDAAQRFQTLRERSVSIGDPAARS